MKTLTLFFTLGTSVAQWKENGSFNREVTLYTRLLTHFESIQWITYGEDDGQYQAALPVGIHIVPKKVRYLPAWLYSLVLPVVCRSYLKHSTWLKTNQLMGAWGAIIAKYLYGKPLLVRTGYTASRFAAHAHSSVWFRALISLIEYISFKSADHTVVTSEEDKTYLVNRYNLPTSKITVIPNGIDANLFQPAKPPTPSATTSLLFVGRLVPQKNVMALLAAITGLKDIALTIIGDGPLRFELEDYAKRCFLSLRLYPAIPNEELPRFYTNADLYVQPSLYEGNPKTILEAMACGLPVLAATSPGISSLIEHGKTGYLCYSDEQSIKAALLTLMNDTPLRTRLGLAARRFIEKHYTLSSLIDKEIKLYV